MSTVSKRLEALEATVSGATCAHCGRDKGKPTLAVRVIESLEDWQPCPACRQPELISPNFGERQLCASSGD